MSEERLANLSFLIDSSAKLAIKGTVTAMAAGPKAACAAETLIKYGSRNSCSSHPQQGGGVGGWTSENGNQTTLMCVNTVVDRFATRLPTLSAPEISPMPIDEPRANFGDPFLLICPVWFDRERLKGGHALARLFDFC